MNPQMNSPYGAAPGLPPMAGLPPTNVRKYLRN